MKKAVLARLLVLFVSYGVIVANTERVVAEERSEESEEYISLPSINFPKQLRLVPKEVANFQWDVHDYVEAHDGECWIFTIDGLKMENYEQKEIIYLS